MKQLDEKVVLDNANYLYNVLCNEEEQEHVHRMNTIYGPNGHMRKAVDRFDRTIGPRSTKAAIRAIVRAINEAAEEEKND